MKLARILAIKMDNWPAHRPVGDRKHAARAHAILQFNGNIYTTMMHSGKAVGEPYFIALSTEKGDDASSAFVTEEQWLLERSRLGAESWNGYKRSMPPINAFCKVVSVEGMSSAETILGKVAEVIGHAKSTAGHKVVLCELPCGALFVTARSSLEKADNPAVAEERKKAEALEVNSLAAQIYADSLSLVVERLRFPYLPVEIQEMYRDQARAIIANKSK